jgi:predicted SAM-dependent methyltransferase
LKVELGSGKNPDPLYDLHLDIDVAQSPDLVADALELPLRANTVTEMKVVDVLEHISYRDTKAALTEWHRVMVKGARIYIQVPEATEAIKRYMRGRIGTRSDLDPLPLVSLAWILMGGQYDQDYIQDKASWRFNSHYALFDQGTLKWYLKEVGFEVESMQVNAHPNILCWAVKV